MTQVCYPVVVGGQNCIQCPEVLAVTAVPGRTITDRNLGWNASAYSVSDIAGDVYTEFSVPANVTGVFCGFADRRVDDNPANIPFAFYVYQSGGQQLWSIYELGVQQTSPVVRVPATDLFRIERRSGAITYFFNNRRYYASAGTILSDLVVLTCMYAAGDGVD